jgi:hypothetical protein
VVRTRHRLAETGLFGDDALAELIERYPRDRYDLLCMAPQGTGNLAEWREGELAEAPGDVQLRAIQQGRMWLNLRRLHEVSPRHGALLRELFAEMSALMPGFKPFKLNLGVLLSSPGAQVYYHADLPGQSLWHIRGRKRVFVYPNRAPYLPEDQIEEIVLNLREAEIAYDPAWDADAQVVELEPGELLSWPLNCPHRVENIGGFCVSVTTEHWTPAIRGSYAVRYANGVLRQRLGLTPPPPTTSGPGFWARAALAAAVKSSGLMRRYHAPKRIEWRLDPDAPGLQREITPFDL